MALKEGETPTVGDLVEKEYWDPPCGMAEHKKQLDLFEKRLNEHMIKEGYKKRRIATSMYAAVPLAEPLYISNEARKELLPEEEAREKLVFLEEEVEFSRI